MAPLVDPLAFVLPLTVYLLRTFFAQIPTELEEAARLDEVRGLGHVLAGDVPHGAARGGHHGDPELHLLLERVPLRGDLHHPAEDRTLPLAIQFLVSDQYQDVGMLATGLMIATLRVLILYLFLSEWFVKGMTAGAIKG